ncbi:kinase-like domain-containing protein [Cyathus striatus]|nr:kinase-like domain-containing protein [Cyathus striatus]
MRMNARLSLDENSIQPTVLNTTVSFSQQQHSGLSTSSFFGAMLPIEAAEEYEVGGFHPISVDDIFNNRYRVINKLSRGANSTVWLVEDLLSKHFASLKVLSAASSLLSFELSVSQHLQMQQARCDSHPGKEHVVRIFDTFTIQGPNGTHHCIVTELLGINLRADVEEFYGEDVEHFPPDVAKKIAAQVALGVAYLHKCGIIHGDLHFGNVLFYSSNLQNASRTEIKRIYGEPLFSPVQYSRDYRKPVPPSIHRPTMLVYSIRNLHLFEICLSSPDNIHIKICVFGESSIYNPCYQFDRPFKSGMPLPYRAPEIIFHDIVSPAPSMDVWALGVLLYAIMNEKRCPFIAGEKDELIQWMVMILGKLPDKWWTRWAARAEYFEENGVHRLTNEMVPMAGIGSIKEKGSFSGEEVNAFQNLLYKIFRYAPEDRIDAEEVVRSIPPTWEEYEEVKTCKIIETGVEDVVTSLNSNTYHDSRDCDIDTLI